MLFKKLLMVCGIYALFFSSCAMFPGWIGVLAVGLSGQGSSSGQQGPTNIYATGLYMTSVSSFGFYSINGSNFTLYPTPSEGKAILKINGTLWIAGSGSNYNACLWSNGVYIELESGSSSTLAMDYYQNSVYVLGYSYNATQLFLWKDGSKTFITNLSGINIASMSVDKADGSVYLCFTTNGPGPTEYYSYYWKQDVSYQLDSPGSSQVYGIYANNGSVCCAGYIITNGFNNACYWNGAALAMASVINQYTEARAVLKDPGGNIIACGRDWDGTNITACVWKNGGIQFMPNAAGYNIYDSRAFSLTLSGSNIIVGGQVAISGGNMAACVWGPSGPYFPVGTNYNTSYVNSVFAAP